MELSAISVFLAIAAFGFLVLLVSLVFGEIFDHLEIGGDDFDHGLEHGGPGFLSTRILSIFVTCFGVFGALASYYEMKILPAAGVGAGGGFFFASLVFFFARFLYRQQASSGVRSGELLGLAARVVVAIPKGGMGQVRCQIGEELVDKIARSEDGEAIPDNAAVVIQQMLGEMVVVRRP